MKNSGFRNIYSRLPRAARMRTYKRNEIIQTCGITQAIFYSWYQGFIRIPDHHKGAIANILNCSIEDLD